MSYTVRISEDAELDVYEIAAYIAKKDLHGKAEQLVENIMEKCSALSTNPERGHIPPELEFLSIKTHLQIHFKPYRIIYRIDGNTIWIDCVLDGRRDINDLLQRRLIR